MPYTVINVLMFCLGAIVGSFLNVCIHRFPREESIVFPGSHCPQCSAPIKWYDNVPLLSYIILKAKCRHCGAGISPRYFFVESMTAVFFLWIWMYFGLTVYAFVAMVLFSLLFIATMVDLEHQIIPDEVNLFGACFGLIISSLYPDLHGQQIWYKGLFYSFIGLLTGGGLIYVTGVLGDFIFKKESMGGGDVKLLAMIGSFLGWEQTLLVFLWAPFLALPLGLFLKFVKKREIIPFGPFLSLSGWLSFLWGNDFIAWYFGGMGLIK